LDAGDDYQITDDTLLYATYRRGYKSGGSTVAAAGTGSRNSSRNS